MKTVACINMPFAREAFETLGDVVCKDGRSITPADVHDADILAIRSTIQVNRALLEKSRVRFVGTATIGTDHMDIPWMEQQGIHWCFAPGCNANSVSEYVTAALLVYATQLGQSLTGKTMGIIGVGNVGTLVAQKAQALGLRVLLNDPPREAREGTSNISWTPLPDLLAQSDIVTLHVPLTKTGPHATFQIANEAFFQHLKPGAVFFNTCRGPVMSSAALLQALDRKTISFSVVDTWENEPSIDKTVVERVSLGTPHIAGHSFEGKVVGTWMVYESACRFLGRQPCWQYEPLLPPAIVPSVEIDTRGRRDEEVLHDVVRRVYDITSDHQALLQGPANGMKKHFDDLRRNYPIRREFRYTTVHAKNAAPALVQKFKGLGFAVQAH